MYGWAGRMDLEALGVIDRIISEPLGGAHREKVQAIFETGIAIQQVLDEFDGMSGPEIRSHRHDKFLQIGKIL